MIDWLFAVLCGLIAVGATLFYMGLPTPPHRRQRMYMVVGWMLTWGAIAGMLTIWAIKG